MITDDSKNTVPYDLTTYCSIHTDPEMEKESTSQEETDDKKEGTTDAIENESSKESSSNDSETKSSDDSDTETKSSGHFWEFWNN